MVTKNHENSPEIKVKKLNSSLALPHLLSIGYPEQLGEGMGVSAERIQSYIARPRRGTWHPRLQQRGLKGEFQHSRCLTTGSKYGFKVEAWIREKELLVSQGDLGKDYEHCMELQRKLEDAGSGATRGVDKERIDQIFQACQIKDDMNSHI